MASFFPLDGFSISNFLSFGNEPQYIGPCSKVNIFIGPNNSGKSNVLSFIAYYKQIHDGCKLGNMPAFSSYSHLNFKDAVSACQIGLAHESPRYMAMLADDIDDHVVGPLLRKILNELRVEGTSSLMSWFPYMQKEGCNNHTGFEQSRLPNCLNALSEHQWSVLRANYLGHNGSGTAESTMFSVLARMSSAFIACPPVQFIPHLREITKSNDDTNYSGKGLIDRLHPILNPIHHEREKNLEIAARITRFVQSVLENSSAQLSIPSDGNSLEVHMDGKFHPIQNIGTGVHQTVILAAACTLLEKHIVCIEEPEVHLHPTLQKKLLHYLSRETDNQYFITTHSSHIIDTPGAAVFRIHLENNQTKLELASTDTERFNICTLLGHRASDLMQANCIIWVEGPSDVIYMRNWLFSIDHTLIEGVHFSLMMYGGNALYHLSGLDYPSGKKESSDNDSSTEDEIAEEALIVDTLISLRRINRRIAIVMDNDDDFDTKSSTATRKKFRQRILEESLKDKFLVWITEDLEIENYLDKSLVAEAITALYPKSQGLAGTKRMYEYIGEKGSTQKANKVSLARLMTKDDPLSLDILDLREKMGEIVSFIRDANGQNKRGIEANTCPENCSCMCHNTSDEKS